MKKLLLISALALLVGGCASNSATAPSPSAASQDSKTIVTVNGHAITDSIVPDGYTQLDAEQQTKFKERLINEELLHAYLLEQDFVKSEAFQTLYEQQKNKAEEAYKKASSKAFDAEQLRNIKGATALAFYQKQQFDTLNISDEQASAFYTQNEEKFNLPNSIEFANIVAPTQDEANSILQKLQSAENLDASFVELAKEKHQKGYMGWFGEGNLPQNLFDAAYSSASKTLLDQPIQTKHGYHVVYLLNKKPAHKLSYSEAQGDIKGMLKQQAIMKGLEAKVNELRANAKIID